MSLRTRIAAAAAIAVALVVVIAAVAIYLGVRAELRGEVDNSLRDRASALTTRGGDHGRGPDEPDGGRPGGPGGAFPILPHEPFGGPEGVAQLVLPSGRRDPAPPPRTTPCRWTRTRAPWRAAARASSSATRPCRGTHVRVLTRGIGSRGAIQIARPLDEVDRQLERVLLVLLLVGAAGVALGAALAAVVARTALAPIDRFTRRTEEIAGDPDPSHRIDVDRRRTSSAGSRAASTRRSTRSSARSRRSASSWRTPATSCAPRSRACGRTSRRSSTPSGCRRPSSSRSAPTSSPSWTS